MKSNWQGLFDIQLHLSNSILMDVNLHRMENNRKAALAKRQQRLIAAAATDKASSTAALDSTESKTAQNGKAQASTRASSAQITQNPDSIASDEGNLLSDTVEVPRSALTFEAAFG